MYFHLSLTFPSPLSPLLSPLQVEDIIFSIVHGQGVEIAQEKIASYERQNAELINRNKAARDKNRKGEKDLLIEEKDKKERQRQIYLEQESLLRASKKKQLRETNAVSNRRFSS